MKKVSFFIMGIISFFRLSAQNTFPASGNVGIGVINPSANEKLSIDVPENIYGITFKKGGNLIGGIHFNSNVFSFDALGVANKFYFGGNVGIGDSNPIHKLSVNGTLLSKKATFMGQSIGANYTDGSVEIREINGVLNTQLSDNYAPRLTFHWGNVVSKSIAIGSNGNFKFNNQNSINSFAGIEVGDILSTGNMTLNGTLQSRYYTVPFNGGIVLHKKADTTAHFNFYDLSLGRVSAFRRLTSGEGNDGLGLFGQENATWKTSMVWKDNGRVGIGTSFPTAQLDVVGLNAANFGTVGQCCAPAYTVGISEATITNSRLPSIQFHAAGLHEAFLRLAADTRVLEIGDHQSVGVDFAIRNTTNTARNVLISGKSNSYFNGGNVGIGTANPQSTLHISSAANSMGALKVDANAASLQASIAFSDRNSNKFVIGKQTDNSFFIYDNSNSKDIVRINNGGNLLLQPVNGQVSIGTSTPYTDYKLSVAGNIIADKVKVRKNTNGAWPDFVFKKDYQLPSLSDIEKYVIENSHLPEIPSAAEIEKDGQDLGEMNRLLLKKVEELTLYLIEQDKKMSKVLEDNSSLNLRVSILEKGKK